MKLFRQVSKYVTPKPCDTNSAKQIALGSDNENH